SQKLEAIGLLAGGIAHDFNNLLTGVVGFLELGLEQLGSATPANAKPRRFVSEARRAANRAVELTRQLLTFSRRTKATPKVIDLNECIERTASMVKRVIGETIDLKLDLVPGSCQVRADADELEQAVVNLAINARDAMARGGTLHIDTHRYAVS